jgi:hypothetical protein
MKLPATTAQRLRLYKTRAAANKIGHNDWRGHRYARTWAPAWHNWSEDRRKIYADERDTLGDYLGDWGAFLNGRAWDATGFYCDGYANDTIKGGAERIRGARFTLYVPVTYCTGWDGVTYHMADAYRVERGATEEEHEEARRDCAAMAYNLAEREADRAREEDAKYQASEQIAQERAEIHEINKSARALLAEIRGQEFTENVCAALRHRLREYLADRRACFKTIAERQENYWSAVPY